MSGYEYAKILQGFEAIDFYQAHTRFIYLTKFFCEETSRFGENIWLCPAIKHGIHIYPILLNYIQSISTSRIFINIC